MNNTITNELIDQELSLEELEDVSGGLLWLLGACWAGFKGCEAKIAKDTVERHLKDRARQANDAYNHAAYDGEDPNGNNQVAPGPNGEGCTGNNFPF